MNKLPVCVDCGRKIRGDYQFCTSKWMFCSMVARNWNSEVERLDKKMFNATSDTLVSEIKSYTHVCPVCNSTILGMQTEQVIHALNKLFGIVEAGSVTDMKVKLPLSDVKRATTLGASEASHKNAKHCDGLCGMSKVWGTKDCDCCLCLKRKREERGVKK